MGILAIITITYIAFFILMGLIKLGEHFGYRDGQLDSLRENEKNYKLTILMIVISVLLPIVSLLWLGYYCGYKEGQLNPPVNYRPLLDHSLHPC
jgi:hypothetical protein